MVNNMSLIRTSFLQGIMPKNILVLNFVATYHVL